jgi:hypothetical protein
MPVAGAIVPISTRRRAVVTRAVVASAADIHAGLHDRAAITIGAITWVVPGGITAAVSGRTVRIDRTPGDERRRSDDDSCDCEFHDVGKTVDRLLIRHRGGAGVPENFVSLYNWRWNYPHIARGETACCSPCNKALLLSVFMR